MLLNSKYPILMAAMNQVSDLNLAIAGHAAGIFPSLSFFNYWQKGTFDLKNFQKDLIQFEAVSGSKNLLISLGAENFLDKFILEIIIDNGFLNIEIADGLDKENIPKIQKIRQDLKKKGLMIYVKDVYPRLVMETDVLILKGNEAAGTISKNSYNLKDSFNYMKNSFPNLLIIPSGGIKDSTDVKYYLDKQAFGVGIGSLFAFSEESCISLETKQRIIDSSREDLISIKGGNQTGLVFKEIDKDNANNTNSLKFGLRGTEKGHIFVGHSIDSITQIKTVKEIVDELVIGIYD